MKDQIERKKKKFFFLIKSFTVRCNEEKIMFHLEDEYVDTIDVLVHVVLINKYINDSK